MAENDRDEIIKKALQDAVVGGALGALLTGKSKGTLASVLLGVAIGASVKAQEEAKELSIPVLYEKNGAIWRVYADGKREFVKKLDRPNHRIPQRFTLA